MRKLTTLDTDFGYTTIYQEFSTVHEAIHLNGEKFNWRTNIALPKTETQLKSTSPVSQADLEKQTKKAEEEVIKYLKTAPVEELEASFIQRVIHRYPENNINYYIYEEGIYKTDWWTDPDYFYQHLAPLRVGRYDENIPVINPKIFLNNEEVRWGITPFLPYLPSNRLLVEGKKEKLNIIKVEVSTIGTLPDPTKILWKTTNNTNWEEADFAVLILEDGFEYLQEINKHNPVVAYTPNHNAQELKDMLRLAINAIDKSLSELDEQLNLDFPIWYQQKHKTPILDRETLDRVLECLGERFNKNPVELIINSDRSVIMNGKKVIVIN